MRRSTLLALFVGLMVASVASADIPLPKDQKYITPRVRFEDVDKYADQVFFLRYHSGAGNPYAGPPTILEVMNAEAFEMKVGRRLASVQLFAVPRDEAAKLRAKDPTLAWVSDKTPGLLVSKVDSPSTVGSVKDKEVPVTAYRVKIKDGKLTVETLPSEKRGEAPADGRLPLVVFGTLVSMSVILFGLWFVRRRGAEVV